ncbi:MAG: hypothetical protein WD990_07145 [Acidimicrobiia bacterium]
MSFYDEKVDIVVDGIVQTRPQTLFGFPPGSEASSGGTDKQSATRACRSADPVRIFVDIPGTGWIPSASQPFEKGNVPTWKEVNPVLMIVAKTDLRGATFGLREVTLDGVGGRTTG